MSVAILVLKVAKESTYSQYIGQHLHRSLDNWKWESCKIYSNVSFMESFPNFHQLAHRATLNSELTQDITFCQFPQAIHPQRCSHAHEGLSHTHTHTQDRNSKRPAREEAKKSLGRVNLVLFDSTPRWDELILHLNTTLNPPVMAWVCMCVCKTLVPPVLPILDELACKSSILLFPWGQIQKTHPQMLPPKLSNCPLIHSSAHQAPLNLSGYHHTSLLCLKASF